MDESIEAVKLYDKLSQVYDDYFSENADHLDEFLALVPKGGKILDVGCGTGKDTGYMASKGFEIIGVDLSEGMLAKAKAKYPDLDLRLEDMRKLDFPKNNFEFLKINGVGQQKLDSFGKSFLKIINNYVEENNIVVSKKFEGN